MPFQRRNLLVSVAAALLVSCGSGRPPEPAPKLTVAAAANLTDVFAEVGTAFTRKTGVEVVFSFGSTAQLAQQIENGAPFDVFAAADAEHVDSLVASKKLIANSRAVYALGQLALWIPKGEETGIREVKDLAEPKVRYIAVAQPELAPYGKASMDVLKNANLFSQVEKKIVYGNNISLTKQLASSGNADAAFTAYALVLHEKGIVLKIDSKLYPPIEQAMGIVAATAQMENAKKFREFLLGGEGKEILARSGYSAP